MLLKTLSNKVTVASNHVIGNFVIIFKYNKMYGHSKGYFVQTLKMIVAQPLTHPSPVSNHMQMINIKTISC